MAVINKDRYLKDIAAALQRSRMYFDKKDRVSFMMGTTKVYISDLSFDFDNGEINYNVSNERGDIFASAHGVRLLREVDVNTLASLSELVDRYHKLALKRQESLGRISSQLSDRSRRSFYSF